MLSRAGRFAVNVMLNGKPVEASPLRLTVVGGRANGLKSRLTIVSQAQTDPNSNNSSPAIGRSGPPAASSASGLAALDSEQSEARVAAILVGKPYRLEVRARDRFGNAVYHGGASVDVKVAEPPVEPGSEADHVLAPKLECVVRDNETGVYFVDVTAALPGRHIMTVSVLPTCSARPPSLWMCMHGATSRHAGCPRAVPCRRALVTCRYQATSVAAASPRCAEADRLPTWLRCAGAPRRH